MDENKSLLYMLIRAIRLRRIDRLLTKTMKYANKTDQLKDKFNNLVEKYNKDYDADFKTFTIF